MCGIVALSSFSPVNQALFNALTILQHRGQDAAGIMTSDGERMHLRKSNGLVRDVVRQPHMLRLQGNVGIGHVRYPTAGSHSPDESQPFYVNSPYGLALVHNGNLTNTVKLTKNIINADLRHLNTTSDSEVLLNVVAHELSKVAGQALTHKALFDAFKAVYQRIDGAYAAILMINGEGIVGFRDPCGIRPLVIGKRHSENGGDEFMIASESIALDALGFDLIDDVKPGEVVFIDGNNKLHRQQCITMKSYSPCIFEYIYLARADSIIDNIPVYQSRLYMGETLADKVAQSDWVKEIDVVIPVPDTSRIAALSLAQKMGINYSEGFVKNRYIGRTFIMPGQQERDNSVRLKLNPVKHEFAGKNVLLVDDSIVRGTTSKKIIQMARDAGAKKVFFASAAPEVKFPNVYGIDMPTAHELIAHNRSVADVAKMIGSDGLVFQNLEDVYNAINRAANSDEFKIKRFEDSIFNGDYITGEISTNYLSYLDGLRNDDAKKNKINLR